jgi:succinoglycan biosynthesis transport protein ExoP
VPDVYSNGSADPDVASVGRAVWARKRLIILSALVAAVVSTVFVNVVTPRYRSEARLLVEGRENAFMRPEAEKTAERTQVDAETIASQVQILTSRDLALAVIKDLNLAKEPEFDPARGGASVGNVLMSLIGLGRDPLRLTAEERTLQTFYDRLSVLPIEKSRVITVEFSSADPELAARAANAVSETYIRFQQMAKQQQNRGAGQWLAGEIEKMRGKVAEAEQKVEEFRAKSNLYVGSSNASLMGQQLTDLNGQLSAARAQKAELDAKSRLIQNMLKSGQAVESTDVINSDLLRRLSEQRATLRAQLAEQSSTLLDRHPRILELKAQISSLDQQIRSELERVARSIENDARIAAARIETTTATLDQLKRQVTSSSSQDVELRALEREAKAQRDLLESYLAKYREATARDSLESTPAEARVISRATVPGIPSFPKKVPIVALATAGTAFVVTAFVVTGAFLVAGSPVPVTPAPQPRTVARGRDRRERTALTSVAEAAPSEATAARLASMTARPQQVGNAEQLAETARGAGDSARRITLVGTTRNVGTTYTAIGLARALAQFKRVVLVDLALRAPNLSVMSTNPDAPGLAELVRGTASFGQIITRDRFSRVHLVATGQVGGEAAAIYASPKVPTTLEALSRAYDHVVIDAGAISEMPVEAFAMFAPWAVLVAADVADPATAAARDRLMAAGFTQVTVFAGGAPRAQAA